MTAKELRALLDLVMSAVARQFHALTKSFSTRVEVLERSVGEVRDETRQLRERGASTLELKLDSKELQPLVAELQATIEAAGTEWRQKLADTIAEWDAKVRTELAHQAGITGEVKGMLAERSAQASPEALLKVAVDALRDSEEAVIKSLTDMLEGRVSQIVLSIDERFTSATAATDAVVKELRGLITAYPKAEALVELVLKPLADSQEASALALTEALEKEITTLSNSIDERFSNASGAVANISDSLKQQIAAVPTAEDIVKLVMPLIRVPKDGKDADPPTEQLLKGIVETIVMAHMPSHEQIQQHITTAVESRIDKWALEFERRAQDTLQRAIERIPIPKDGLPGRDAFPLESVQIELVDEGKTLAITMGNGKDTVTRKIPFPGIRWRGYFKDGETYMYGDTLQSRGSSFMAIATTTEPPNEGNKAWILLVKAGRDGKSIKGDKGDKGDPGVTPEPQMKNPLDPLGGA